MPVFALVIFAGAMFALSVFGLRGLSDIHHALRFAELQRLANPAHWQVTRVWLGAVAALPVVFAGSSLENGVWLAALGVAGLGYTVAPRFLASARQRVEQELLDDLPVHLDLIALALEAGLGFSAALSRCAERAPDGALRRAWARVLLDLQAGAEPLESLRALELRTGVKSLGLLAAALRSAEKFGIPAAQVFRERARHSAVQRFARAEHLARTAPLKLWAALVLAIIPCTFVVLAFPLARLLVLIAGQ